MIKAGPDSFPWLHAPMARCREILSCPVPELYITTNPVLNAYTAGQRRTCIVLHSGLVEKLTPDELCFVIGHEIGHIKCAHGLYRQLGDLLVRYWDLLASVVPIPGLGMLRVPLLLAYWEWYRRAEFTCDVRLRHAGQFEAQVLPEVRREAGRGRRAVDLGDGPVEEPGVELLYTLGKNEKAPRNLPGSLAPGICLVTSPGRCARARTPDARASRRRCARRRPRAGSCRRSPARSPARSPRRRRSARR